MCTTFSLYLKGSNSPDVITARTMDFARDLKTQVKVIPQGQSFPSLENTPLKNPLKWQNKYGYVSMECNLGLPTATATSDGLNEAGLSVAALWLPDSVYASSESATTPTIYNSCLPDWILGNFDSVAAVQYALENITVINIKERFPVHIVLHYVISDQDGNNLIVEFTNGQLQTYEPDNAVMTNAPTYNYQLVNLDNYDLSLTSNPKVVWGQEVNGSGCYGMPGDFSPPSRFVRATTYRQAIDNYTPQNKQEAIALTTRILQNCLVPMGTIKAANNGDLDYTQWGVVRDQKELVYYFFSTFNINLFAVDLKQFDLSQGTPQTMPLIQDQWVSYLTPLATA
jgi:choloylglycine hydrolase